MKILPAIDIKDGQAVRLFKGDLVRRRWSIPMFWSKLEFSKKPGLP